MNEMMTWGWHRRVVFASSLLDTGVNAIDLSQWQNTDYKDTGSIRLLYNTHIFLSLFPKTPRTVNYSLILLGDSTNYLVV